VFSAGVVLWASLALRLPFEGASNYETAKKVCEAKRVAPSKYNTDVSPELDALRAECARGRSRASIPSAREFQSKSSRFSRSFGEASARRRTPHRRRALGRKQPDAQFTELTPPRVVEKPAEKLRADSVDLVMQTPIWGPVRPKR